MKLTNMDIMQSLKENNLMLNVYVSDGLYITRVVENTPNKKAVNIASSNSLENSIHKAVQPLFEPEAQNQSEGTLV